MKSFGSYISKYLVSFVAFILILLFLNAVVFGLTFQKIVTEDYGDSSPQAMLEMTATAATPEQLSDEAVQMLRQNHISECFPKQHFQIVQKNHNLDFGTLPPQSTDFHTEPKDWWRLHSVLWFSMVLCLHNQLTSLLNQRTECKRHQSYQKNLAPAQFQ